MGAPARRPGHRAAEPLCARRVRRTRPPSPRLPPGPQRDAADHGRIRLAQAHGRGRVRPGHAGGLGRRRADRRRAGGPSRLRRIPPLRRAEPAARLRDGALRRAGRAHAVLGPSDADLRHPRARGDRGPAEGDPHSQPSDGPTGPHPGVRRLVAVLGGDRHRVRGQSRDDVPAAADRGASPPAEGLGGARRPCRRPPEGRGDPPVRRNPLGRPALPQVRDDRGAGMRREFESRRGARRGRAGPLPGGDRLARARRRARASRPPTGVRRNQ